MIDMDKFNYNDLKTFYGDVREDIPPDDPAAWGKEVDLRCYVDANNAEDLKMHRLRTVLFIFLNKDPFDWYSKWKNIVESDVFGLEFVTQNIAMERLRELLCKLHIMGIPISGTTYMYGENM